MKNIITTILAIVLTHCALSAQRFDNVKIISEQVTEQFYLLRGSGGNIGLFIGEETSLMIDAQFAPLSEKIMTKIDELTKIRPDYLLNTHWHGDHTGGNGNFAEMGLVICAHENVRERLSSDQMIKAFNRKVEASEENYWPTVTFSESMTLHIEDETILFFHHHSGHTDGDGLVYFLKNNVIHMGDVFFQGKYPYIDLSTGGSVDGLISTVNEVLFVINDETKVVPGHGKLADKAGLTSYREVLIECKRRVADAIAKGMSFEEIQSSDLLSDYNEQYGTGFIKPDAFVNTLYTDLTREK